jgi:hypothetical protein
MRVCRLLKCCLPSFVFAAIKVVAQLYLVSGLSNAGNSSCQGLAQQSPRVVRGSDRVQQAVRLSGKTPCESAPGAVLWLRRT